MKYCDQRLKGAKKQWFNIRYFIVRGNFIEHNYYKKLKMTVY